MFRGGGWSEDLFLRYSAPDTANQIAMIKNLGLNGIRTEGKQMPDDFYEQFDRAGLLVDAGYQCCDAWQLQDSKLTTPHDFALLGLSARAIGMNLRNHPSILNFSWSDNQPTAEQEAVSVAGFRAADFQEPLIASAEYKSSPKLGPSGEKEGPYDWVPPSYWYDTTHYDPSDPSRTNVGGAWAFDSEAGAGHTVPTLDSIARFMSPFEQTQLWTNPDYNQYHANYEPDLPNPTTNSGYSFGTLHDLDTAISHRYGPWTQSGQLRARGPGPELRDPAGAVRGLYRSLHPPAGAVDRRGLLAAEQGLADAAVGPLQPRPRPGGQLLRGQEGQRGPARALRL